MTTLYDKKFVIMVR